MKWDTENMTLAEIVKNKKSIIKTKKQTPIYSECQINKAATLQTKGIGTKAAGESDDPNRLKVTIVGNTALWCDSHMDVLAVGSYSKSVNEQGANIPHLRDHIHTLEGKIGKTQKVYTEMIGVEDLGITSDVKQTEVLLMDSEVVKEWAPKIFQLYKDEEVKQHSIGLQYVRVILCANNPEYKDEFANWEEHYSKVINKEKIDERGYFWFVTEIKIFEISAVLFGSNEMTPTVSTEKNEDLTAPSGKKDTQEEEESPAPSSDTQALRRRKQLLTN